MPDELLGELLSLLLPLHYFYAREGIDLPKIELLAGGQLPEPQQSLLVHDRDMTSTLKMFHAADVALEVLTHERSEDYLMRMVVLRNAETDEPIEFGALGVRLEKFEGPLREAIAEGRGPLGGLLEQYLIDYRSSPKSYFRVPADPHIARALEAREGATLYGRCNELTDPEGFAFADIVEILPDQRAEK